MADSTAAPYTAYSYLTAGEDFRAFELAPEFGRVPPYQARLTASQAERDHPVRFPARMEETPEYNRTGRQHAAYAGLAASGLNVVFDNMMDGTACVTGNAPWRWDDIITDLGMRPVRSGENLGNAMSGREAAAELGVLEQLVARWVAEDGAA